VAGARDLNATFAEWTIDAGWRLQRDAAALVRDLFGGTPDIGRGAMRLLLRTAEESAAGAAFLATTDEARAAWLELRNKVETFRAFEHVDALLGVRVDEHGLADLVSRAARLPPPLSVWAAEGVAYHTSAAQCRRSATLDFLDGADTVPSWSWVPLHAGMGAAVAAHVLDAVRDDPSDAHLDDAIADFFDLCARNADPGHIDVALEALGFTARAMFGELLPRLERLVRAKYPALTPLVRHGAGRAVYFAPSSALPLADTRRRTLDELVDTPATDLERTNTIAGFAWAATLVNLRHPAVLEPLASEAARLAVVAPFARGIHDALAVWRRCAPGDLALARFETHVPADPRRREPWARLISAATPRHVVEAGELFQVPANGAR
jgi:hypothetical protein